LISTSHFRGTCSSSLLLIGVSSATALLSRETLISACLLDYSPNAAPVETSSGESAALCQLSQLEAPIHILFSVWC